MRMLNSRAAGVAALAAGVLAVAGRGVPFNGGFLLAALAGTAAALVYANRVSRA